MHHVLRSIPYDFTFSVTTFNKGYHDFDVIDRHLNNKPMTITIIQLKILWFINKPINLHALVLEILLLVQCFQFVLTLEKNIHTRVER